MLKILLVDDHEPSLSITASLLKNIGYTITTAINGADALDKIRQNPPDVVVSDVLMPVMDGYALCRELKKDEVLKSIPVIFVSATFVDPQDKKLGLGLGAEAFIVKDREAYEFMRELQNVIRNCTDEAHNTTEPAKLEKKFKEKYHEALNRKLQEKILQFEDANRRLSESEEKYRNVYETAPLGFVVWDKNGCITDWNKQAEKIFGWSLEEVKGKNFFNFLIPPEVLPKVEDVVQSLLDGEIQTDVVNQNLTKSGNVITCSWNSSPLYDDEGQIIGAMSLALDITEKVKSEKALRESERYNRMLFEKSTIGLALCRMTGELVDVNPAFAEIIGRTVDETLQLTYWDITPQEYQEEEQRQLEILEKNGRFGPYEKEYIHKDGFRVPVRLLGLVLEKDGEPFIWSSVEDITERKQAESALKESEERLDLAMSVKNDGMYDWDVTTNSIYFDPRYYMMAGYEPYEFPGTFDEWAQRVHPEDFERIEPVVNAYLAGESPEYEEEFRFRRKDGKWMWIRAQVKTVDRNKNGSPLRVVGTHTDITKRKQAEEALRSLAVTFSALSGEELFFKVSEHLASTLDMDYAFVGELNETETGVQVIGGFARGQRMQPFEYELTDTPCQNVVGQKICTYPSGVQDLFPKDALLVEMGVESYIGAPLFEKYGKPLGIMVLLDSKPVQHQETAKSLFNIFNDRIAAEIERMRAEEHARLQREQLIQADKMVALGTLVSGVGHEINNPNTYIMSGASQVKKLWSSLLPLLDSEYDEKGDFAVGNWQYTEIRERLPVLLEGIIDGSKRIKHIVSGLKAFSRKEDSSAMKPVRLNNTVEEALTMVSNMISKSTRHLSVDLDRNLPEISGKSQQLEQVLINLLINACQALPDKKKGIQVITSHNRSTNRVEIIVRDEGIGIGSKDLQQITDPFFTTKRDTGGTGLGLSISSRIVNEHKGTIEFQSKLGKGTTVKLTFPAN